MARLPFSLELDFFTFVLITTFFIILVLREWGLEAGGGMAQLPFPLQLLFLCFL